MYTYTNKSNKMKQIFVLYVYFGRSFHSANASIVLRLRYAGGI